MATINALTSANTYGNTGILTPFTDLKNIIGALIAPKGYEIDVTTIQSALLAACLSDNPLLRLYPIFDFEATKDSSEQKTVQSMATGAKHVVKEGYNDHSFQFVAGGKDLQANLRKFNGANWDFYYIDGGESNGSNSQKLIGITGSTSTKLRAIPTDGGYIWTDNFVLNDATKIAEYMIGFVFKQKFLNDLIAFVQLPFDAATTLYGLADANVVGVADATSGTYNITLTTKTGANLGDKYSSTIATISLWVASNAQTGLPIVISSAGYDIPTKAYKVALLKTDANYPTTGKVTINITTPTVLDAAGVKGIESTGGVSITKN